MTYPMGAFVYCWTDKKTNMLYVGSHKGSTDDGYICSSKYMLAEYNKRPEDFSRQIVAEGTHVQMRTLESKILIADNAAMNESYYNMHNNNGKYILKKHTKETKLKISQSEKGKIVSEESKLKMRMSKLGEKNNRFGLKLSEETKKKMSDSAKGRVFSSTHRENLSKNKKGRSWYHDPITGKTALLFPENKPNNWIQGRK